VQSLPTPHFPWLSIGCNFHGPYCAREGADGDAARSKVGDHDVLSNICTRSIPVTSTPEAGQCTQSFPHLCFSKFLPDRRHGLTSFNGREFAGKPGQKAEARAPRSPRSLGGSESSVENSRPRNKKRKARTKARCAAPHICASRQLFCSQL